MEVRPFLTTGVAIASAGVLIAALPAIAPPLATKDVKVYADPNMKLAADLEELINVFFKSAPGDPDAPGTIGIPGIFHQLLLDANEGDADAQEVIDAFFGSGASEVVRIFLTRDNADPATVAQINAFFNGGISELVRLRLVTSTSDPTQQLQINRFFEGGFTQLIGENLLDANGAPSSAQYQLINAFFFGYPFAVEDDPATPDVDESAEAGPAGFTGVSHLIIDGLTSGADPNIQTQIDNFFDGGVTPVVQKILVDSTNDPTQKVQINRFFEGGATKLVGDNLLDANGDPTSPQYQAIDSFFYGYPFGDDRGPAGFTGLAHFIIDNLMGNVPPPAPADPPADPPDDEPLDPLPPGGLGGAVNTLADTGAPEVKSPPANEPLSNGPSIQVRLSTPAEVVDSAAQAVGNLAPAAPAAAPPATAPEKQPVSNEEDGSKDNKLTDEQINSGNMVKPELILFQNGGGGGSAWETESLPRWRDALNRLGIGGGAPAPAPSPEPSAEGGAEAGAEG